MSKNGKIHKIIHSMAWLFGFGGRVADFRSWLFRVGTRVVEFMNSFAIMGFSVAMLIDQLDGKIDMFDIAAYELISKHTTEITWIVFFLLGLLQFILMVFTSYRSNQASGLTLIFSGSLWAIISASFYGSGDSVTTAAYIYALVSFLDTCAGHEMLKKNKMLEDTESEER